MSIPLSGSDDPQVQALLAENRRLAAEVESARNFRASVMKTITHDVQNVIMGVMGFAQLALMMDSLEEKDENLADVVRATRLLREMVENFATFARLDTMELSPKELDLAALAREAAASLQAPADRWPMELPTGPVLVVGDPRQLRQVMVQLVSNAVRFSPEGGAVRVRVEDADGGVQVVVEDAGVGIPRELQDALFEPFQRAKRPDTSEIPGAGLGLAIVRHLAALHGGRAWLESERGQGTRAFVTLPRTPS